MPDADDFDVEYFRNLLKGDAGKQQDVPPVAKEAGPAAKRAVRGAAKPAAGGGKKRPAARRKRG